VIWFFDIEEEIYGNMCHKERNDDTYHPARKVNIHKFDTFLRNKSN